MAWTSGKYQICAEPACDSIDLTTTRESFDEHDGIFVGEQKCDKCGCLMLFSRRPSTPEEINMAKKKPAARGKSTSKKKDAVTLKGPGGKVLVKGTDQAFKDAAHKAAHRVTTFGANGAESMEVAPETVSVGEAMRLAVEALGDVKIDDDLAPKQLAELAECYEDIERRRAAFNAKNDDAKVAKKSSLESATDLLLEKIRLFTHPKPLPLFDQAQAETDRDYMVAGSGVPDPLDSRADAEL